MNVNSFQDRENVIPCQALTKQAKNWSSILGKNLINIQQGTVIPGQILIYDMK